MRKGRKSKRGFTLLASLVVVFGFAVSAHAALIDRGGGLIYDDDFDITWLQDANYAMTSGYDLDGTMTWDAANTWANNLVYGGYSDWRLPTALNQDGSGPCGWGYDCTGSEMGHLYYTELGNSAGVLPTNTGPFSNLHASAYGDEYWAGPGPSAHYNWLFAWGTGFGYSYGWQGEGYTGSMFYAWAVRDGDVSHPGVPEPGTMLLLGLGLAGLAAWRRLGRKQG